MELLKWLSISDRYTKMHLDRELAPLGLNSSQHMYILKICQEPGITQDKFINVFYIHPSNVTRSIAYLEKADFIRKEPHPKDKRTCCLYPTEKGLAAYADILNIQSNWHERLLADFSPEERELFLAFLHKAGKKAILEVTKEIENQ
ncbi:MarR family transcriptional regulator [Niameybacter massiliensis]|uniref:MarR family transcriptional regulator n=1 Tax=Holtiella tumoricola TaxID=3018743 RepID=A0AA42DLF0_9FIRM|nr:MULTISPECIES: MarR family transcriptional regulator [Lachnospirales]MDA3731080.1 MarR family transcriptional regulator [Holtiella tumoricola]